MLLNLKSALETCLEVQVSRIIRLKREELKESKKVMGSKQATQCVKKREQEEPTAQQPAGTPTRPDQKSKATYNHSVTTDDQ
jgi:uncharacterized membrane protein